NWYRAQLELAGGGNVAGDWWHFADGDWGAGFLQNPACDFCDDVVAETADIAFGDAWVEPYASDGPGHQRRRGARSRASRAPRRSDPRRTPGARAGRRRFHRRDPGRRLATPPR